MQKISRRRLIRRAIQSSALLPLATHPWFAIASRLSSKNLLLVGTQTSGMSKGIYAYNLDAATGDLTEIGLAAEADNPTFLAIAPNRKTVFAANELDQYEGKKSGAISSFTLNRRDAKLVKINEVASLGDGSCHVSVDHTGRCAFAANYSGGSAASFAVGAHGQLSTAVSFFQYSGHGPKTQQQTAHAHRVTVSPNNKFLLVNDLGLDQIHIYHLDAATAKLTPSDPPAWKSAAGAGPRALRFHPNGKWAYCVNELDSTVNLLNWDGINGILDTLQVISLLPEGHTGPSAASEVVFDKQARFAYVANRLDDFIATFAISPEDGKLTIVERTSSGGKVPRHMALDPTGRWLLVANQVSDNIAVFARDSRSGRLANSGKSFPFSKPQCLVFA